MSIQIKRMRMVRLAVAFLLVGVGMGASASPSVASGPALKLYMMQPTTALSGEEVEMVLNVFNNGDATTTEPITFTDTVGPGLGSMLLIPSFVASTDHEPSVFSGEPSCSVNGSTGTCTIPWLLPPGAMLAVRVGYTLASNASGSLSNTVTVSGGGVPAPVREEASIAVEPRGPFAFTRTAAELLNADGSQDVQAASDPADFTSVLHFRSFSYQLQGANRQFASDEHFEDVRVNLPVGLVGNPAVVPQCTAQQLAEFISHGAGAPRCPIDSQIGVVHLSTGFFPGFFVGLYNMVPPPGVTTELGFDVEGVIVLLDATLRPGDNGITVLSKSTTTTLAVRDVDVTVWGDSADKSHDSLRGPCLARGAASGPLCPAVASERKAFLRMPTSCPGTPLGFEAIVNSYEHPSSYIESSFSSPAVQGCDVVPFAPGIDVTPTATVANSPTGVSVKLSLQQNSNPDGLAEADLKKAVVTLPEGMALNPSSADGLQACTDAQLHLGSNTPAECPDGSKVGTVELHTPLLAEPINGSIYVRTQNSSDPSSGEMFRLAIELRNDPRGIDIKVPGQVAADPLTGRLTSTFDNNPQLPFSDISLHFKAGARAPLTTPFSCQPQTTEADLYSWAQPSIPVHRAMTFNLTSGPEGTGCPGASPAFNPGFNAGVSSVQAGGFTPFLATFSRKDADQSMQRVSVKLPLGLSGSLAGLPLCPEAQASTGMCSQASEIGTVTAGAGSGPTPFYVTGGKVFMTGPYEGAPFGLSIVVPAKAGPYDLGNVNVRARVDVDPVTAQLTVTSDPLPQIVGGVPVNLRLVNVTINRSAFTFNPTNCDPLSVTGTMTGGQGAVATVANHFQVTNCGALAFKPVFKVSTTGKTSRRNGAGLAVKLTYPKDGFGKDSNIAKVKVSLPKQLPSRLETLQKACPAATFQANPAGCPAASRVGSATASTPIIPVPLSGPVYFVSHGGAAFPDLVIVLQGYGVTVDLVGSTFINEKTSVTSTTFKQIPDVPVGTFELKLPQGRFSALAANGNLCTSKLKMPTAFVAQDGAEMHQSTPIGVTGCARHKAKKAKAHPKHGKRR